MPRSLGITFATPEDLESEYGTNIANGGIFLASEESFSLRERVCVEIGLPFCSERLQLRGEVVTSVRAASRSCTRSSRPFRFSGTSSTRTLRPDGRLSPPR